MNVVELHPEDLLDKLAAGQLTPAEGDRLQAHLAQCAGCRFEVGVRGDLAREAKLSDERPQISFAGASIHVPLPPPDSALREAAVRESSLRSTRSRRRWSLSLLPAALLMCAGGAAAAVLAGAIPPPWQPSPATSKVLAPPGPLAAPKLAKRLLASDARDHSGQSSELALETVAPSASVELVEPSLKARSRPARSPMLAASSAVHASDSPTSAGAASLPSPAPRDPAATLFAEANRARRDGNADRAVALYRSLQARFPNSSESEVSRALLAQLQLERGSPEAALDGFDHYLAESTPVLAAEALVGRARALEQLGKTARAVAAWQQVQRQFPGSVHARLAATRLSVLGSR